MVDVAFSPLFTLGANPSGVLCPSCTQLTWASSALTGLEGNLWRPVLAASTMRPAPVSCFVPSLCAAGWPGQMEKGPEEVGAGGAPLLGEAPGTCPSRAPLHPQPILCFPCFSFALHPLPTAPIGVLLEVPLWDS